MKQKNGRKSEGNKKKMEINIVTLLKKSYPNTAI